jgi:hypothetical protein
MSLPRIAVASTWHGEGSKYWHAFQDTARRQGITVHNFDDSKWPGDDWRTIEWWRKSAGQAKFVDDHAGDFDFFIFVDSHDVIWTAGLEEIFEKYMRLNSPIVFAAECYCWPDQAQAALYPPTPHRCKYLNAGFWMASAKAALPFTQELAQIAAKKEKCDQGIVADMFLSKRHPIALDTGCSICFCCNMDSLSHLNLIPGCRPSAIDTGEFPCRFHGNGASDLRGICAVIAP